MSADNALIAARLRAERKKRRMTVQAVAEAFRDHATERERRRLPKLKDLCRTIRGHEAAEHPPGPRYRMLYAAVYDMSEDDLFGDDGEAQSSPWRVPGVNPNDRVTPDDEERLALATVRATRPDSRVVESLATVLAEQRRLEDAVGSAPVLQVVEVQLPMVQRLVAEARGPVRPGLVDVAAQWAQFSGWLNIAVGNAPAARMSLDRAAEHAEEIGDAAMVGTVLSWKAYLAERTGQIGPMVGMARAAQRNRIGPGHAYDLFLEARGRALGGEPREAERLLGEARTAAADAEPEDARPWEYYYLEPGFFTLEAGVTNVYLGRDDPQRNAQAVELLTAGLAELPTEMRGAEWAGEYIAHQAVAQLQASEAESACAAVLEAAGIAHATSSESLLRRLREIYGRMLRKWPTDPAVTGLLDALR
ncbi:XRE family transcriptional regulator [Actinoallomurus spadix]|uniref:XRE family transcriptional regulator n=1 Tax=Actinoallomurus spadix TaxID=79912 RepID=A0ABP3GXC5_9ACTN|nr:XRE family transcriptional regulator [Actinoallomurus spadix]MCO5987059.1 XRE family transcriptional regulator [Actinoallomurus spadix]